MATILNPDVPVAVEYSSRGVRTTKVCKDQYEARRFYVAKFKAGAEPKVVKVEQSSTALQVSTPVSVEGVSIMTDSTTTVAEATTPKTKVTAAPGVTKTVKKAAPKKAAAKVETKTAPVKKAAPTTATVAPVKKAAPKAEGEKTKKDELRKPQVRILQALAKHGELTRNGISEKGEVDLAACTEYVGSDDKAKREANDVKHFPSLLSLKLVSAATYPTKSGAEGPTHYKITAAGTKVLEKVQA